MKTGLRPEQNCSASRGAVDDGLIGIALTALHQIHHTVANDIPNDVYQHILGEWIVGPLSGAILFAVITALKKQLKKRH